MKPARGEILGRFCCFLYTLRARRYLYCVGKCGNIMGINQLIKAKTEQKIRMFYNPYFQLAQPKSLRLWFGVFFICADLSAFVIGTALQITDI